MAAMSGNSVTKKDTEKGSDGADAFSPDCFIGKLRLRARENASDPFRCRACPPPTSPAAAPHCRRKWQPCLARTPPARVCFQECGGCPRFGGGSPCPP